VRSSHGQNSRETRRRYLDRRHHPDRERLGLFRRQVARPDQGPHALDEGPQLSRVEGNVSGGPSSRQLSPSTRRPCPRSTLSLCACTGAAGCSGLLSVSAMPPQSCGPSRSCEPRGSCRVRWGPNGDIHRFRQLGVKTMNVPSPVAGRGTLARTRRPGAVRPAKGLPGGTTSPAALVSSVVAYFPASAGAANTSPRLARRRTEKAPLGLQTSGRGADHGSSKPIPCLGLIIRCVPFVFPNCAPLISQSRP
jgi:hypothetical protein